MPVAAVTCCFFFKNFILFVLAALSLCCCAQAFSSCSDGVSFIVGCGFIAEMASRCGAWALRA